MRGGKITVGLAAQGNGPLRGQIDARNFAIINEPRLAKIVSSSPSNGGTSLSQAVKRDIDVSRVDIERGFSLIEKGNGYLNLSKGVVRGPTVGTTFQERFMTSRATCRSPEHSCPPTASTGCLVNCPSSVRCSATAVIAA